MNYYKIHKSLQKHTENLDTKGNQIFHRFNSQFPPKSSKRENAQLVFAQTHNLGDNVNNWTGYKGKCSTEKRERKRGWNLLSVVNSTANQAMQRNRFHVSPQ